MLSGDLPFVWTTAMADDNEIAALTIIASALEPLDIGARKRALAWALSRFGYESGSLGSPSFDRPEIVADDAGKGDQGSEFEAFADLFSKAGPKTEKDKALLAGYWVQVVGGQIGFPSQALNAELKDLGHGIGNITEALTALKNERPALALQVKKSGSSRQARKVYKLTQEGIRRVRQMVDRNGGDETE